jgi:hypothetical protein
VLATGSALAGGLGKVFVAVLLFFVAHVLGLQCMRLSYLRQLFSC